MPRFTDKVALVSGAGSGIGLATAARLAAEGATVIAGIADESQRAALAGLAAAADTLVLEVRGEADWARAVAHAESHRGGLDVLVNCAGIHRSGGVLDTSHELWDEVLAVNLWGSFLGCRTAIPALARRGGGAIVNLASIAGIRGVPGALAYASSKGGIVALTMALALEVVEERIRVNCVCPGAVATPLLEQIIGRAPEPAACRATLAARHPMDRLGRPEEVAATIAFLASDDAAFLTGVALPVDGGRSVR